MTWSLLLLLLLLLIRCTLVYASADFDVQVNTIMSLNKNQIATKNK